MVGHVGAAGKRQAFLHGTSSYIAPVLAPRWVFFWERLRTEGFPQRVPTPLTLPQGTSGKASCLGHQHGCKRERGGLEVARPCSRLGGCQRATGAVVVGVPRTALPSWTPVPERPVGFGKHLPFCWGHLRGIAEMFQERCWDGAVCSACAQAPAGGRRAVCCRLQGRTLSTRLFICMSGKGKRGPAPPRGIAQSKQPPDASSIVPQPLGPPSLPRGRPQQHSHPGTYGRGTSALGFP